MSNQLLPSITPEAYLKPGVMDRPVVDELSDKIVAITQFYAELDSTDLNNHPMIEEEKIVLESILKYIDLCAPSEFIYRKVSSNSRLRWSRYLCHNALRLELPELEHDDILQEARLTTILQNRKFDNTRGFSLLSALPLVIVSTIETRASKALTRGMTGVRGLKASPINGVRPNRQNGYDKVRIRAVTDRTEKGWSDAMQELQNHPFYFEHVSQESVPDGLELHDMVYDQSDAHIAKPLVPRYNCIDESVNTEVLVMNSEVTIVNILEIIESSTDLILKAKERELLEYYYTDGLTFEAISKKWGVTKQCVQQVHKKVIELLRADEQVLMQLQELAAF